MARIMVIDDDAGIRELLTRILEAAGHEAVVAPNGKVGTAMYRANPTDLIITDIIMPEKQGMETIVDLRKEFPQVKIIAMSGGGSRIGPYSYLMLAKQCGAERVFNKPLRKNELLEAIGEMLTG
jgi:DNA-binding response OmpR family regulator